MLAQLEFRVIPRTDLEAVTNDWLRQAVYFIGGSWFSHSQKCKTLLEVSASLQLRWFNQHGIPKAAIEHKSHSGQRWLGGYSVSNYDPFVFDYFYRGQTPSVPDIEKIESITRTYLPQIEVVQCSVCGARFGNSLLDDGWRCDECRADFPAETRNRAGFVYIFGSTDKGYFKIGCGNSPDARMKDYQLSKLPFPVEMIHTIPVDDKAKAEAELHRLFRDKCTNGEWFTLSGEDLGRITGLRKYVAGHWVTL